jgi:hypothetical protein
LGGFIGYTFSNNPSDDQWLAGDSPSYPTPVTLVDDGQWHSVEIPVPATAEPVRLIVEDWSGSAGIPEDVYFDNIDVSPVPEPSTQALLVGGLLGGAALRRKFARS